MHPFVNDFMIHLAFGCRFCRDHVHRNHNQECRPPSKNAAFFAVSSSTACTVKEKRALHQVHSLLLIKELVQQWLSSQQSWHRHKEHSQQHSPSFRANSSTTTLSFSHSTKELYLLLHMHSTIIYNICWVLNMLGAFWWDRKQDICRVLNHPCGLWQKIRQATAELTLVGYRATDFMGCLLPSKI